jgi:hypothetical protein
MSFALHFRRAGNVRPNYISGGENNLDSRDECQAGHFYVDKIFVIATVSDRAENSEPCNM